MQEIGCVTRFSTDGSPLEKKKFCKHRRRMITIIVNWARFMNDDQFAVKGKIKKIKIRDCKLEVFLFKLILVNLYI